MNIFLLLSALFLGCTKKGKYRQVDPMETQGLLRNRLAVLIDVREKEELRSGIAQGAQWMPMSKIKDQHPDWIALKGKLKGKDEGMMLIFYCAAGGRAGKVARQLGGEGFTTGNMGGFSDWVNAKLPIRPCKECGFSTIH